MTDPPDGTELAAGTGLPSGSELLAASEWSRDAAELRRVHRPLLSSYGPPRCRSCENAWPCYGARLADQPGPPWDGWLRGDDYEQAAVL